MIGRYRPPLPPFWLYFPFFFSGASDILILCLELIRGRLGVMSAEIRKLFFIILTTLIEKSPVSVTQLHYLFWRKDQNYFLLNQGIVERKAKWKVDGFFMFYQKSVDKGTNNFNLNMSSNSNLATSRCFSLSITYSLAAIRRRKLKTLHFSKMDNEWRQTSRDCKNFLNVRNEIMHLKCIFAMKFFSWVYAYH